MDISRLHRWIQLLAVCPYSVVKENYMERMAIARAGALSLFASVSLACANPAYSNDYTFKTLDNGAGPNFNALLGINDVGTLTGFYGTGTEGSARGYRLVPPSTYTPENYPGAVETLVVGINNWGTTVGFFGSGSGTQFGFYKQGGAFRPVSDPNTPSTGATVNALLGVNDCGVAAGYYADAFKSNHGYTYNIRTNSFTPVVLPASFGAISAVATDINDWNNISGIYVVNPAPNVYKIFGFLEVGGTFASLSAPNSALTVAYGLNNIGDVVGYYIDSTTGETQGFLYNWIMKTWRTISDPLASPTTVFGVNGTTVNGVNDWGDLVGWYSDGVRVNGFLAIRDHSLHRDAPRGAAAVGFSPDRKDCDFPPKRWPSPGAPRSGP
jgi:hypothetical protein